ncbi:hypothetical protein A2697_01820 [Candidatus Curtissbacteria bacterium RIFCSPHIGHO2_01_FULL_41_44]|uniref:Polysaccharide biosynthesis protein C-terminal domain-containing protein n=1 Tax=Candidatus Curtissbacteria bacterium RIFCSPLOWO2_01_FULL_42_50 TaxID=1797730 RepID=A0A1F5H6G5_9BACT|nr:MAG: hypothetical protein A2697_01820 [Candidatus Curtissbacteria bacterium RIFCSPHIGHO2_01_FULL_41_44]OGD99668.1 MAG: hypothetical protein A3B54_03195 [Candidatus Curtissbacteria bacterium RIFCSPLOWO2_01_FULL_42_50]
MLTYLKSLLATDTGKDTSIVVIGTIINAVIGGLFFLFAPRILDNPANFGLFATVISTGLMMAAIANFGLDTGIFKFAYKGSTETNAILSLALRTYMILGLIVAILGVFIAPAVANLLGQPVLTQPLRIAFLGTIFILLTNFFVAALQAKQKFIESSIVNISASLARIIILAIGFYFFSAGLYFLTTLFFFVNIVSVIVGKFFLPLKIEKTKKRLASAYFKYNFWVASALIISSIPFDNYILLKLAGPFQTGLYAAPFKLFTFSYQIGGNFTRVLASRLASFDSDQKAARFALKASIMPLIFILAPLFLITASPYIPLILGKGYLATPATSQILRIIGIGFIFFFASTIPSSLILYYFGKSSVSFIITSVRYILFIILLVILVPSQKAVGGALAFSITEFAAFILMSAYVILKFAKVKNDKH